MKLYISDQAATKSAVSSRWFMPVKRAEGARKIIFLAWGDTRQEAENVAAELVELWNRHLLTKKAKTMTYKPSWAKAAQWMTDNKDNVDVVVVEHPDGKMQIPGYGTAVNSFTAKQVIKHLSLLALPGYKHSARAYSMCTIYVFPENINRY